MPTPRSSSPPAQDGAGAVQWHAGVDPSVTVDDRREIEDRLRDYVALIPRIEKGFRSYAYTLDVGRWKVTFLFDHVPVISVLRAAFDFVEPP